MSCQGASRWRGGKVSELLGFQAATVRMARRRSTPVSNNMSTLIYMSITQHVQPLMKLLNPRIPKYKLSTSLCASPRERGRKIAGSVVTLMSAPDVAIWRMVV